MMVAGSYRVLLLADVKWRDLAGVVYLKLMLEKKFGHRCLICPVDYANIYIRVFGPDLIVLNNCLGTFQVKLSQKFKEAGGAVAVLPTEGWTPNESLLELLAGKYSDFSNVDLYLAWGIPVCDAIVRLGSLPANRVVLTGPSRFDFYSEPLRRALPTAEKLCRTHGLPIGRPIVTWTTNFGYAKFAFRNQDFNRQDMENNKLTRIKGYQDPASRALQDHKFRVRALDDFRYVVSALPHVNFLIKPHPHEDVPLYEKYVESLQRNNVRVIFGCHIWDLLAGTDVLVQSSCTTGIEGWLMEKPTLELHLLADWAAYLKADAEGHDVVVSRDDWIRKLRYYLDGGHIATSQLAARRKYLKKWLYGLDGHSTERCATALDQLLHKAKPKLRGWNYKVSLKGALRTKLCERFYLPYSQPLRPWLWLRRPNIALDDWKGLRDRTSHPSDVQFWQKALRPFLNQSGDIPEVVEKLVRAA